MYNIECPICDLELSLNTLICLHLNERQIPPLPIKENTLHSLVKNLCVLNGRRF